MRLWDVEAGAGSGERASGSFSRWTSESMTLSGDSVQG